MALLRVVSLGRRETGLLRLRKAADFRRIVIALDMLAGAGDGDAVQYLEKVKIELFKQRSGGALF